jgi:hypothetical protein
MPGGLFDRMARGGLDDVPGGLLDLVGHGYLIFTVKINSGKIG